MTTLSARGLRARIGARDLLAELDLDVAPGEVVAVTGESGSGKTTLGLALQGEHQPAVEVTGSLRLHDAELLDLDVRDRRTARAGVIGYLPQHPAAVLNPMRRIGATLTELAGVRHRDRAARRAAAVRALRSARLDATSDLLRRYPHQLSGGQQQRVALAHALVNEPELLILDEPTTGLDPATESETAETLAGLVRGGTAVVLLTHDLAFARRLATHAAVLRGGHLVERGLPDSVLVTRSRVAAGSKGTFLSPRTAAFPRFHSAPPVARELQARDLGTTAANGARLLAGVDLTVTSGRCVAVVGRSGAGKTTLARCLAGLTSRDSGEVWLDGTPLAPDIRQRDRRQRGQVQYVHQDARSSFDHSRSVVAQVARTAQRMLGMNRRDAHQATVQALEALGVREADARRRPPELSGGQLQRAALARALLACPALLICDEITSAQDGINQAELLRTLRHVLATTPTGLLLISHDPRKIGEIADEIHVLDDGRCVERAPAEKLLARPRSTAARDLITNGR